MKMTSRFYNPKAKISNFAVLLAPLLLAAQTPAHAEANVTGTVDSVRLEAHAASLEEVLSAFGTAFNLRYHTSTALVESVNGTYSGSLQRLLSRLLDGYNFVIKTSDNEIEVAIYGGEREGQTPVWRVEAPNLPSPPQGGYRPGPPVPVPTLSAEAASRAERHRTR
jgi:hypothetical protein